MNIKKTLYRFLIFLFLMLLSFPDKSSLFSKEEMTPNNMLISMGHKGGGHKGGHSGHKGHRGHRSGHRGSHHAGHRGGTHVRGQGGIRGQGVYRSYQNYSPTLPEFQTQDEYPQYYFYEPMDESNDLPPEMLFHMSQVPKEAYYENVPTLPPDEVQVQPPIQLSKKPPEKSPPQATQMKLPRKVAVDLRKLPPEIKEAVSKSCLKRYFDPDEIDSFMDQINYNLYIACVVEAINRYFQQHPGGPKGEPQEQAPQEPQTPQEPPPIAASSIRIGN